MIILQDTREQTPWLFESYAQKEATLAEGDYAIEGYHNLICIERKRTVVEIAGNLGKNYQRFLNEMNRMQKYRFRYVVCEFTEEMVLIYPKGTNLSKRIVSKIRMSGKFLMKRINEIIEQYGVEFVFCDNRYEAKNKAVELLLKAKSIYDNERINQSTN
jgi:translation initiation factor 2 beta subunit (eIF-2beta)/eIF-5